MQKFNKKFHAHAIHSLKHFKYNPVPKTEVPETRTDRSLTVHDSTHGLAEHFILLNSKLKKISIESKNAQSEFEQKSYGRPQLALPISKGGAVMRAYPVFHSTQICSILGRRARP